MEIGLKGNQACGNAATIYIISEIKTICAGVWEWVSTYYDFEAILQQALVISVII
jgi:hypothetical protein